jgi:hemerythrin
MLAWDRALETGSAEIDDQHRLLFRKADAVLEAVRAGMSAPEVERTLKFLSNYAALHFEAEERIMRSAGFPGADSHAEVHRRMERRLAQVAEDFARQGASATLLAEVEALMRGWITVHIMEADRAIADWMAARGAKA